MFRQKSRRRLMQQMGTLTFPPPLSVYGHDDKPFTPFDSLNGKLEREKKWGGELKLLNFRNFRGLF